MNNPMRIFRNTPTQVIFTITLPHGQTLSGKSLTFTAKASPQVPNTDDLFVKTSSPASGITITGDFTAEMDIDAADTVSLSNFAMQTFACNLVLTVGTDHYPLPGVESLIVMGNPIEAIP